MKKGTKPKLENARIKTLAFKVSDSERENIRENAKARGLSPSSFSRLAVLGKRMPSSPTPTVNIKTWGELGRIGNNLNQISERLNRRGDYVEADIYKVVSELQAQIQQIRNEISGVENDTEF